MTTPGCLPDRNVLDEAGSRYYRARACALDERISESEGRGDLISADRLKAEQQDLEKRAQEWLLASAFSQPPREGDQAQVSWGSGLREKVDVFALAFADREVPFSIGRRRDRFALLLARRGQLTGGAGQRIDHRLARAELP